MGKRPALCNYAGAGVGIFVTSHGVFQSSIKMHASHESKISRSALGTWQCQAASASNIQQVTNMWWINLPFLFYSFESVIQGREMSPGSSWHGAVG